MNDVLNLNDKDFNFYVNLTIISVTILIVTYLLKRNSIDLNNIDSYDWNKFNIVGENKSKFKKMEGKEKPKMRIKEYSKGTGFIKEEHKFPVLIDNKKPNDTNFLTFEETNNFQDLINYAATMNKEKENAYPIESLYNLVQNETYTDTSKIENEKIDNEINDILKK